MDIYLAEGGRLLTGKRFLGLEQQGSSHVVAHFEDGSQLSAVLLVGADGARSRVRSQLFGDACLRYSGASCWRGMIDHVPDTLLRSSTGQHRNMYKTVVHPQFRNVSFTCGWTTRDRCFWVLDVEHPKDHDLPREELHDFLLKKTEAFDPEIQTVIRSTPSHAILHTDVYDCRNIPKSKGSVVLIGDAGHAVVHHFGQGACLAIEDAIALAEALVDTVIASEEPTATSPQQTLVITPATAAAAMKLFDTWARWWRTRLLVLISRWCGWLYMHNHWLVNTVLVLCLSWPLHLLFIVVMKGLLFYSDARLRHVSRRFAKQQA
eukprot:m.13816 g.13816  ORF g.13816 m.13816 type:complete len:320 (-) comp7428_c0_seq1:17-976(-)